MIFCRDLEQNEPMVYKAKHREARYYFSEARERGTILSPTRAVLKFHDGETQKNRCALVHHSEKRFNLSGFR